MTLSAGAGCCRVHVWGAAGEGEGDRLQDGCLHVSSQCMQMCDMSNVFPRICKCGRFLFVSAVNRQVRSHHHVLACVLRVCILNVPAYIDVLSVLQVCACVLSFLSRCEHPFVSSVYAHVGGQCIQLPVQPCLQCVHTAIAAFCDQM